MRRIKALMMLIISILAISIASASMLSLPSRQASADWELSGTKLKGSYNIGDYVYIPEYKLNIDGKLIGAGFSLELPDGTNVKTRSNKLELIGKYIVHYYAVYEGKGYSKDVEFEVRSQAYRVSSPDSSAEYDRYNLNLCNSDALVVRLAQNDTLEFSMIYDTEDLKKSTNLIEGFIAPDKMGSADFNKLIVRLYDAVDPTIYVDIELNRSQYGTISGSAYVGVSAGAYNQDRIGIEMNGGSIKLHKNDDFGSLIIHSFIAMRNSNGGWSTPLEEYKNDSSPFTVSFDNETLSVYSQNSYVTRLNDSQYYEELFEGFPSGKVKMSVFADGYLSSTANFCITKAMGLGIDGLIDNSYNDGEGPVITIDTGYKTMPNAEVGYAYPIPNAEAYDYASGARDVEVSVYYNYAISPVSVSVIDGTFTPQSIGQYIIEYKSKDNTGTTTIETLTVRAVEKIDTLMVSNPKERTTAAKCGDKVLVNQPSIIGGSGNYDLVITANKGPKSLVITDTFIPDEAGAWTIRYSVRDYLGREDYAEYKVSVSANSEPVFDYSITYPIAYISGCTYSLPIVEACDYSTGKLVKRLCQIVVKDSNGERTYESGSEFKPLIGDGLDHIEISYVLDGKRSEAVSVSVINARSGSQVNHSAYILGEGIETSTEDIKSGIKVFAKSGTSGSWVFANKIISGDASLKIGALEGYQNYSGYEFKFIDSVSRKSVTASLISKNKLTSILTVSGTSIEISHGITSESQFTIYYENGKIKFQTDTIKTGIRIASYDDETAFDNFEVSNSVYISVSLLDAKSNSGYIVYSVSNMNLSYRNKDNIEPKIEVLGPVGGSTSYGTIYTVPMAVAGDVLSPSIKLSLTATDSEGNIVKDINGLALDCVPCDTEYKVRLDKYGVFTFTYTAEELDWIGNKKNLVNAVTVIDEEPPVITFSGSTASEARVGDTIIMPDFEIVDNISQKENITVIKYVINAHGKFVMLESDSNSVRADYVGKYTFMIFAYDEFGNSSSAYYEVMVRE